MIFQPSWFILYFIFSINSIVFYEIFYNVTASRDVPYLFTDSDEICTTYVTMNSKHILFVRIFRFSIFFFEIITILIFIYIYIKYDREFIDRDEICTAYVKSNSKHILFMRIFFIYDILFEIITIIM